MPSTASECPVKLAPSYDRFFELMWAYAQLRYDDRNRTRCDGVYFHVDDDERKAIRAEGLDPDDPAVPAALDLVRWELELLGMDDL
jgi:hypothetical protein